MRWRWPSPSWRLVALFGAVTGLGLLGVLVGVPWSAALALDALLALAFAIDAWRGRQASLEAVRRLPRPLRAFAANPIELELRSALPYPVQVRFLDQTPPSLACQGHTGQLELQPGDVASLSYTATGPRGSVAFGDLHLLLAGPWGLAVWPSQVRLAEASQVVPDLRDREDALAQARARPEAGLARLRRLGEGRELDSLRMYRQGDDVRQVDWKASAKRGELVSREYTPEKNQVVWLLLDCGRQMVVQEGARTRLDWAIEGALRLARASLERGDAVGLLAFGAQTKVLVPPAKGRAHLRRLVEVCTPLQPELEESDYGAAFDLLLRRQVRRALVVVLSDVGDEDASRTLLVRLLGLRPRHLPLLVALADGALTERAQAVPAGPDEAYARVAAARLLKEREGVLSLLRQSGAQVVSTRSDGLASEALNAYLSIKARGLL